MIVSNLNDFNFLSSMKKDIRKYKRDNNIVFIKNNNLYNLITIKTKEKLQSESEINLKKEKEKLKVYSEINSNDNGDFNAFYMSAYVVLLTAIVQVFLDMLKSQNNQMIINLTGGYILLAIIAIGIIIIRSICQVKNDNNFIIYKAGINALEELIEEKQNQQQKSKKNSNKIVKPKPRRKRK